MLRVIFIATIVAFGSTAVAQKLAVQVDTLRAVRPFGPHVEYTFPSLRTPDRPEIAHRINRSLMRELLDTAWDSVPANCFKEVWGSVDDQGAIVPPRLQQLEWSVDRPFPDLLVITFSAEGCGAYCESFTTHLSYDLNHGKLVTFEDILLGSERGTVLDSVALQWRIIVQQRMRAAEEQLRSGALSVEGTALEHAIVSMYRSCSEQRAQHEVPISSYQPLEQVIRLHIERCSTHAERALDELGAVTIDLPYAWLEPYLKPVFRDLFMRR